MIEFSGVLSKETERFIWKEHKKIDAIVWCSVGLVWSIFVIVFALTVELIFGLFLIPALFAMISPIIPYGKYEKERWLPQKIFIDFEEETIVFKSSRFEDFHMLSDIGKIEDFGDWYYFRFSAGDRSFKYVCQKDLTSKEELDEFQKRFEDLIVTVDED